MEAGEKAEVSVTFPDSGTLVFFCKYHQDMGMRGGASGLERLAPCFAPDDAWNEDE